MTDIASIIPDTATVPVAQDLVHPTSQQIGHQSLAGAASPLNSSVSSRNSAGLESPPNHVLLNSKLRSDSAAQELEAKQNGIEPLSVDKAEEPAKPKTGIFQTAAGLVEAPLKGPRNGIHWGADRIRLATEKAKSNFAHPLGVKPKHRKIVRTFGQIGWVLKGLVYAIIGGLACQSSAQGTEKIKGADISPQGAFILVGNNSFGYPLLVVMAVGVLIYACWRFWEGITGQGSDDAFGPFKNFFRYRLSPLVSGCVYTAYGIFVITLIPRFKRIESADNQGGFPDSWATSDIGKFGIAIFGLAFLIATITQLQAAFTRNFHYDMKDDLPRWFMWVLVVTGHIGFLGRAGVFLFVGVLFFRLIADPSINNSNETTIGNGLAQLQTNRGGRACLFILGFFLIIYGTFAVLNAYGKVYPTPPPSRRPIRVKQARLAAERAAREGDEATENEQGTALEQTDKAGRHKLGEPAWNHPAHQALGVPENIAHDPQDSPKTADYKQRLRERYLANRDIEAGLGEEWAARSTVGSASRPHWGHQLWRSSHGQANGIPQSLGGTVAPVASVAPVAAVAPVAREGVNVDVQNPPSTGWV
ncbi:TPA: hypothetical protein ACH3X1_000673 [Trebouxia sp. C0004]